LKEKKKQVLIAKLKNEQQELRIKLDKLTLRLSELIDSNAAKSVHGKRATHLIAVSNVD